MKPVAVRIAAFVRAQLRRGAGPAAAEVRVVPAVVGELVPARRASAAAARPGPGTCWPIMKNVAGTPSRSSVASSGRRVRGRPVVVRQRDLLARAARGSPGPRRAACSPSRPPGRRARRTCRSRAARASGTAPPACRASARPCPVPGVAPPVCAADAAPHEAGVATTDQRSAPGCRPSTPGVARTTRVPARGCATLPSTVREPRRSAQAPARRSTHTGARAERDAEVARARGELRRVDARARAHGQHEVAIDLAERDAAQVQRRAVGREVVDAAARARAERGCRADHHGERHGRRRERAAHDDHRARMSAGADGSAPAALRA